MGLTVSVLLFVVGCSGDDGGAATTVATTTGSSSSTTSTTVVTTTAAPTTAAAPTTTRAPTTTVPPTTSVEDLKAQIAADYVAADERLTAWLASPSTDDLEQRLSTVALPGSEFERLVRERIESLVRVRDVVVLNDPPVNIVTVESLTLDPASPSEGAVLVVCQADNFKTVTPAENSPVGEEILSSGGDLTAARFEVHMTRTDDGWLRDDFPEQYLGYYEGVSECAQA